MKKNIAVLCLTTLLISVVSAAGSRANSGAANAATAVNSAATSAVADGHYPVSITTYNYAGEAVVTTYAKAPDKVLCVYQGCVETMIALGLEDHVLKSYGLDNPVKAEWEAGFAKMKYDDSVFAPDKETVMMLGPDMIFSWGSYFGERRLGDIDYWISSGTNTYINSNTRAGGLPRTLENEYIDILNIGRIFNVEAKAEALVSEMKKEIADALAAAAGKAKKNVAIIEFLDPMSNYGGSTLGGDMVVQLGAVLSIPDANKIGREDLIASDPDVIFVVYMARPEDGGDAVKDEQLAKVLLEPSLASLSAVKNGTVYPIMLGDMYASAVRAIDGIQTFSRGIYAK
jgi:iron complex transport system substrate-binding protein